MKNKATKMWIDHNGNEVPPQYVSRHDKERDRLARKVAAEAEKLSEKLTEFKEQTLAKCDDMYQEMLDNYKVKNKGQGKGNFTITSFDKSVKIEVSVQERVEFDDLIQVAQEKINEYLAGKTGDIDSEIQQIIQLAFQTTKGRMDVKRVLSLFKLNIKHKLWIEAMDILKKSINRNVSRRYVRVWIKDEKGEYRAVELNFSSL